MNEPLRRALLRARLREDDVAARLGVDPKTLRRWLNGRVPYPHNRAAIAELVGADEADLWPDAGGPLAARTRPEELGTVYPHRSCPMPGGRQAVAALRTGVATNNGTSAHFSDRVEKDIGSRH